VASRQVAELLNNDSNSEMNPDRQKAENEEEDEEMLFDLDKTGTGT